MTNIKQRPLGILVLCLGFIVSRQTPNTGSTPMPATTNPTATRDLEVRPKSIGRDWRQTVRLVIAKEIVAGLV
jgi:hypothetical protein